jgi:hypothetical protein
MIIYGTYLYTIIKRKMFGAIVYIFLNVKTIELKFPNCWVSNSFGTNKFQLSIKQHDSNCNDQI